MGRRPPHITNSSTKHTSVIDARDRCAHGTVPRHGGVSGVSVMSMRNDCCIGKAHADKNKTFGTFKSRAVQCTECVSLSDGALFVPCKGEELRVRRLPIVVGKIVGA